MKLSDFIQWERKKGQPIYRQDGRTIRPVSRILTLSWRPYGGGVWNWPVAIELEENGTFQELPIININLWAQVGIGLMVFTAGLLIWAAAKHRS